MIVIHHPNVMAAKPKDPTKTFEIVENPRLRSLSYQPIAVVSKPDSPSGNGCETTDQNFSHMFDVESPLMAQMLHCLRPNV
jgi:hypothetical protein